MSKQAKARCEWYDKRASRLCRVHVHREKDIYCKEHKDIHRAWLKRMEERAAFPPTRRRAILHRVPTGKRFNPTAGFNSKSAGDSGKRNQSQGVGT